MAEKDTFGLLAQFDDPEALMHGILKLHEKVQAEGIDGWNDREGGFGIRVDQP